MYRIANERVHFTWAAGFARGQHNYDTADEARAAAQEWIDQYRPDVKNVVIYRHEVQEMWPV